MTDGERAIAQIVEQGMCEKYGEPSCSRCANEKGCFIAFMGRSVSIQPSYVSAPGCGRFEPKHVVKEGAECQ